MLFDADAVLCGGEGSPAQRVLEEEYQGGLDAPSAARDSPNRILMQSMVWREGVQCCLMLLPNALVWYHRKPKSCCCCSSRAGSDHVQGVEQQETESLCLTPIPVENLSSHLKGEGVKSPPFSFNGNTL